MNNREIADRKINVEILRLADDLCSIDCIYNEWHTSDGWFAYKGIEIAAMATWHLHEGTSLAGSAYMLVLIDSLKKEIVNGI